MMFLEFLKQISLCTRDVDGLYEKSPKSHCQTLANQKLFVGVIASATIRISTYAKATYAVRRHAFRKL